MRGPAFEFLRPVDACTAGGSASGLPGRNRIPSPFPRAHLGLRVLRHLQEALSALRVPLNKRRLAVVDAAFASIAAAPGEEEGDGISAGAGAVPLVQVAGRMNPEGHPEVAAGRLNSQEVRLEAFGTNACRAYLASAVSTLSFK